MVTRRWSWVLDRYGADGPPRPTGVSDEEWTIFTRRVYEPNTIRGLAADMGIPRDRISQAEAHVLHRIRCDEQANRERCPTCGGTGRVPRVTGSADDAAA